MLQKAIARRAVRDQFDDLANEDYDFMFNAKWQSTDESATTADSAHEEAALRDAARNEDGGLARVAAYKKRKVREVWTTRTPNFRSQQVCARVFLQR